MLPSRLITPPTAEAELVSVAELAWNCRLATDPAQDYTGPDAAYLARLLVTAREYVEEDTRRWLALQTRQAFARDFADCFLLTANLQAITAVHYYTADGVQNTLADDYYLPMWSPRSTVDGIEFRLNRGAEPMTAFPAVDQRSDAVLIDYTTGYATPEQAPQTLRQAIILLASHWFEHREAANITGGGIEIKEIPLAYEMLVQRYRIEGPIA